MTTGDNSYPHVGVDEQLECIQRLNRGHKKITILGAGMAGLAAAYELRRLGHEVSLIEGSGRPGGRVFTHRFKDDSYGELGAMRVPGSHDYTRHYVHLLGLSLVPFINSTPENILDIRGVLTRVKDGPRHLYPLYDLPPAYRDTASGGQIFGMLIDQAMATLTEAEVRSLFLGEVTTDLLRYYESLSLGEYLTAQAGGAVRAITSDYTGLQTFWDRGFTVFLREEFEHTGVDLATIAGGMERLPQGLAAEVQRMGVEIRWHTEVTGIRVHSERDIELELCDAERGRRSERNEFVLCTIPFSVLRRMNLHGFSSAKLEAIGNISYVSAFKLLIDCRERFWERSGILGGASISDQLERQLFYPGDDAHVTPAPGAAAARAGRGSFHRQAMVAARPKSTTSENKPGALLVYNWGQDAQRLGNLHPEERLETTLQKIERFHPEIREYMVGHTAMAWDQHRWSTGAFSLFRPGEIAAYYPGAVRNEGHLYFAGEHCSTDNGWIQGALISALRAVLGIASA
jgi:monoamine oxidase